MKEEIKNLQAYLNAKHQKEELSSDKVELSMMADADKLYKEIVKGAQRQASTLFKVEKELKALESKAREMQALENKIEAMAKELGLDNGVDINFASDDWVQTLSKNADRVGTIASIL